MQSGISANPKRLNPASQELHTAFNTLVSDPTQRGLLASISNETLVPTTTIPSSSPSFKADLSSLQSHLTPTAAVYILLKTDGAAADGYVAITYVPDAAPVRQKMLFAATRLTLVRELGVERFRETIFATTKEELSEQGWERHERHTRLAAPLTEEEEGLRGVREAEEMEGRGTGARRNHTGSGIQLELGRGVLRALEGLKEGEEGFQFLSTNLSRQQKIDAGSESLQLDSQSTDIQPSAIATSISHTEPRYTFYRYPHPSSPASSPTIVFMYSCPTGSKIKERMLYAASRARVIDIAQQDAGLTIAKRLEASSPTEWDEETLRAEFEEKKVETKGFARPKRPGRR
ncbi:Twinfilin-1 [Zalaria obscura]|uniref:Twinfilin-1 n=1 Tax=Zalaria obscura TaxID=2024903 RepID=A0ACC3S9P7_9PEZI